VVHSLKRKQKSVITHSHYKV